MMVIRRLALRLIWFLPAAILFSIVFINSNNSHLEQFANYEIPVAEDHLSTPNISSQTTTESKVLKQLTTTLAYSAPNCQPQKHYVFIKTHKSGSTTLIALFQKYAYLNQLNMMVPAMDNNVHLSWPFQFVPHISHMASPGNKPFDVLVNHIVYNKKTVQPLMHPATKYLTVLRDPVPHLISAYQYFSVNVNNSFLRKGPQDFEKFLSDPMTYDPRPAWIEKMKKIKVSPQIGSFTRNLQSADLGFPHSQFDNITAIVEFIQEITRDFQNILILERLSESLVLMKRKFCWSMEDILHVNKNIQKMSWKWNIQDINRDLVPKIYQWNNVDTALYQMANKKLDEQRLGEIDLEREIKIYESINKKVSRYCLANRKKFVTQTPPSPLVIKATEFNKRFEVDAKVCMMMLMSEEDFTLMHKCRQYPNYTQCRVNYRKLNQFEMLVSGRYYMTQRNTVTR